MGKIDGVDLGTVTGAREMRVRNTVRKTMWGSQSYVRDLVSSVKRWNIEGYLLEPTQAAIEAVNELDGRVALVELTEHTRLRSGFVRVTSIAWRYDEGAADVHYYDIIVEEVPAIGLTYIQTSEAFLHSLAYRRNLVEFDPFRGYHNIQLDANRLIYTWEFFLDNDKAGVQAPIVEVQVGDDVSSVQIYGWKNADWVLIGDWGDADAWNAAKNFTDDGSVVHEFKLNKDTVGDTVAGIGTMTRKMGNDWRVLFHCTNLSAQGAADASDDYHSDQLLLKIVVEHSARETGRYPVITYDDGGLDEGVA